MIQDRTRRSTVLFAAVLFALGTASAAAQDLPAGHVPIPQSPDRDAPAVVVLEAMSGGGYTYARGVMDGEEAWFAGPQTTLSVGDTVLVSDPMPMRNFESRSLGRTFDVLYFVGGYEKADAAGATPGAGFGPEGAAREVLAGGGYTYVHVDTEDGPLWVAGPMTQVAVGDVVSWPAGSTMRDFTSRTLGRTFEEILFVQQIVVVR